MNVGYHLIVELSDCNPEVLRKVADVERIMTEAVNEAGLTMVDNKFHQFAPEGVTGVVLLAESHVTIHTWPEYRYAAVDIFVCGREQLRRKAHRVREHLMQRFGAGRVKCRAIIRGGSL